MSFNPENYFLIFACIWLWGGHVRHAPRKTYTIYNLLILMKKRLHKFTHSYTNLHIIDI